ncbi:MAG: ATP-binding cassette domain-containing protein [Bacteroidetes bacterium]|nr:ATP-binding cassette domain-containing protein [Bacteroidota bacterium]
MSSDHPHLDLEEIFFTHGGKTHLENLSVSFERGSFSVILGGSGSGKTIFLKIIGGILFPDSGSVFIDGVNTEQSSEPEEKSIRRRVSFVFQDGALLSNLTVLENLLLPLDFHFPDRDRSGKVDLIQRYLTKYSLSDIRDKRPAELSQAQKKLAGFIRAIVTEPEIVLIDEPLASVDQASVRLLLRELQELKQKKTTVILCAQSLGKFELLCDRILIFKDGTVLEDAPPARLKHSQNPVTRELLHLD